MRGITVKLRDMCAFVNKILHNQKSVRGHAAKNGSVFG
ncbi:hypothetical protein A11S_1323 [Micavibrio aeruginosavorus EPB]|uniref:Uncharacterized protein n=1 Tax=Micavibrio aeruginosavorus EPB TaxID=349215 RepID=M4VFI9_9BACT|nr:hypothetical protein A11S_1323 [Micavibrio aeruginosavorus EPB]